MVLYFSGTGNSRYVAKEIAKTANDEIISINRKLKSNDFSPLKSEKPFVFVGPVYAGRFPRVMDDFIDRVDFCGSNEAYFIGTCAATPWKTADYAEKTCEKKHFKSLGFNSIIMPQGYVAGGGTQPKEVNDKILRDAAPKIKAVANIVKDNKPLENEKPGNGVMSKLINPIMYKFLINAKGFTVNDSCAGCGKCAERCPLNNIKMVDEKPSWGKDCTHCMACIAGCPHMAIDYGKKTQGKPRYYLDE